MWTANSGLLGNVVEPVSTSVIATSPGGTLLCPGILEGDEGVGCGNLILVVRGISVARR
jgi:hypothetical protein